MVNLLAQEETPGIEYNIERKNLLRDDVQAYLTQIGQMPLLSREEELRIAKKVELTRKKYRKALLSVPYAIELAIEKLSKAYNQEIHIFRIVEYPESKKSKEDPNREIRLKLPKNLSALEERLERIRHYQLLYHSKATNEAEILREIRMTTREVYLLLEQTPLRTEQIENILKSLENEYERMLKSLGDEARKELELILSFGDDIDYRMQTIKRDHDEYEATKNEFTIRNLRLVVNIAKKYKRRGLSFLDLIQEGNIGLMKAIDKYDYRRGNKFSTLATWWIRQNIERAISQQTRTIRIPVHRVGYIKKIRDARERLYQEFGRKPSIEELAEKLGISIKEVRKLIKLFKQPFSLETPLHDIEDSNFLSLLEDKRTNYPDILANYKLVKEEVEAVLNTLPYKEREIIRRRFGISDGSSHTLGEIGKIMGVSRQRIKQIEAQSLKKLQHPLRARRLEYLLKA